MYIASFSTHISPIQSYNRNSSVQSDKTDSSFKDKLLQAQSAYSINKSFPVDYINKESTFFNKLRLQKETAHDEELSKTLDESLHVSSFEILKKRTDSYLQTQTKITSTSKKQEPLKPKLGEIRFAVQKATVAGLYMSNDAYFHKRAV